MFTREDYDRIHALTFGDPTYSGYRPEVQESPNGDGVWDQKKRYAHVAMKYSPCAELMSYFNAAMAEAIRVCRKLSVPEGLYPDRNQCCLRILEYPPGASSAKHTDFDFMTLQLYRELPNLFVRDPGWLASDEEVSNGIHFGEMAEAAGFRPAMPHWVEACGMTQRSIVFFVLPSPDAVLERKGWGSPLTAGAWLSERYARSRRQAEDKT
jgi:hypothetical protein